MVIIQSLKHNTFQDVNVPSGRDLFARVGPRQTSLRDYSGDDFIAPGLSKIDAASNVQREIDASIKDSV